MAKLFNTSGRGLWASYINKCQGAVYRMGSTLNSMQLSQVVFHSNFGTHIENLALLEKITNIGLWYTRNEIGDSLKNMSSVAEVVDFKLPEMSCWSKLSSAQQSRYFTGGVQQVLPVSVFSGRRKQALGKTLFEYFADRLGPMSAYSRTTNSISLREKYIQMQTVILTDCKTNNGNSIFLGSADWFLVPQNGPVSYLNESEEAKLERTDGVFEVKIKCFLSSGEQEY